MEHVVFFPAHDGSPAFRRVANLQDAVRLVEHLRNVEGVSEVSVHSLAEVKLAFKPYYKVEVPAGEETPAEPEPEPAPTAAPAVVPALAPEAPAPVAAVVELPVQSDPAPEAAAAEQDASKESGAASLGFFAS